MEDRTPSPQPPARYVMVGGFLGSGKTTAIGQLARHVVGAGKRVGLITNDQAGGLVDTRLLRTQGYATEEIAGGCFCGRFDSLVDAANKLANQTKPDVFIAEPVGSCTDLVATVAYPLRRMYGDAFRIAPLSILVDPVRALRIFGLEPGGSFSSKVIYIYKKQIEEANLILLNKSDLVSTGDLQRLRDVLARNFPKARILVTSTRNGSGLEEWYRHLIGSEQPEQQRPLTLDYDVYADGEANLGWYNTTIRLSAETEFEAGALLQKLAAGIQTRLQAKQAEVAHLKITLSPADPLVVGLASVQLVRNDHIPELGMHLDGPISGGELVVNFRAEAPSIVLAEACRSSLAETVGRFESLRADVEHEEHFQPGRPEPSGDAAGVDKTNCGCGPGCC